MNIILVSLMYVFRSVPDRTSDRPIPDPHPASEHQRARRHCAGRADVRCENVHAART